MSTQRIHHAHHFQCDAPSCHEFFEGDERERLEAVWHRARAEGWSGRADGSGDWDHFCPECSREPMLRIVNGGKV